ncbi:MAG: hypothetical protein ACLFR0_06925 [Alphaproteobacteria bacterium]
MKLFSLLLCLPVFALSFFAPKNVYAQKVIIESYPAYNCNIVMKNEENLSDILESNKDVFLLTCPIDDELLDDNVAKEECILRKHRYLTNHPYTYTSFPTVAVNGRYIMSSYFTNIVNSGVKLAHSEKQLGQITISYEDNNLRAHMPDIGTYQAYDLWIFAYSRERQGVIALRTQATHDNSEHEHDEDGNHIDPALDVDPSGRMSQDISFKNVVKTLKKLGQWDGRAENIVIPLHDFKADGFAIAAQEKNTGPIAAFGYFELSGQKNH